MSTLFTLLRSASSKVILITRSSSNVGTPPVSVMKSPPSTSDCKLKRVTSTDDAEMTSENVSDSIPLFRSNKKSFSSGGVVSLMTLVA